MPKSTVIIGAAGCGKTTRLLDTMEKVMTDPYLIGFVSFTRAARGEAAARAADRFGLNPEGLERDGWFRTLHSCCYRQLAVGDELLAPGRKTAEWIAGEIQDEVSGTGEPQSEDGDFIAERTPADVALHLWSVARNRLAPFSTVYERAWRCDERTPERDYCRRIIERYEQAKRLNHRCDFTDLLGRYAGWRFQVDGPLQCTPEGDVPEVDVWFLDEAQDNSALTDAVAQRLTSSARWAYLVGDPWQAIYGFSGADPSLFQRWPTGDGKRHVLAKSWRCPSEIVALGEACIRDCADYWDRGVEPRSSGGRVEAIQYGDQWPEDIHPNDSWLLLARTNYVARRLQQRLNAAGCPWHPIRSNGGWKSPQRTEALSGLLGLSRGDAVSVPEWQAVLKLLPSRVNGQELLTRGTKTNWSAEDGDFRTMDGITDWGATEVLKDGVRSGRWVEWIDRGPEFKAAFERWGWDAVLRPKVRVGTIHSAKGMEADNVLIFTTTSHQVEQSRLDQFGADEEARLAYVAVTRARERVVIARERTQFAMEIPA